MDIASIKTHGKYYSQKTLEIMIYLQRKYHYKIIHDKNYKKLYKLLFKAHEN